MLKTADSVLYHGRKVILLTASAIPILVLLSQDIAFAVHVSFFFLGLAAFTTFCFLESLKSSDEKILLGMNICNKTLAYCFPFSVGLAVSLELIPLTTTIAGIAIGVICSSALSLGMSIPIERSYLNERK